SKAGACVPANVEYGSVYTDAQCTGVLLTEGGTCPPIPKYGLLPQPDSCAPTMAVTIGSQVAAPAQMYTSNGNGTCTTTTEPAGTPYSSIGSPITLPQVARRADTAANRRMQHVRFSSGSAQYADYALYDTVLGTECFAYSRDGGTSYRCYPLGASIDPV